MDYLENNERSDHTPQAKLATHHAKNKYQRENIWGLQGALLDVFSNVEKWILIQYPSRDTKIKFILPSKFFYLFTNNIHNRLLAVFRKYYKIVVLLELEDPKIEQNRLKKEADKQKKYEHMEMLSMKEKSKKQAV